MLYYKSTLGIILCMLLCCFSPFTSVHAKNGTDKQEAKELLQKGLTVFEIDRELDRLTEQENKIGKQINETVTGIEEQNAQVNKTRVHAAKVLRAYYTGERDSIWLVLFSMKSFSEALATYDYISMIMQNDHRTLTNFIQSTNKLKELRTKLEASRTELQKNKESYLAQKVRYLELQADLNKQLAANSEGKQLGKQIEDLNQRWQQKGIPLFKQYFQALSVAMKDLPELVTKNGNKNTNLILNGLNTSFQITDAELNEFLRRKNELFTRLAFHFTAEQVIASGKQEDMEITIKGKYTVEQVDHKNAIKFHVDQLVFNGFTLPDTTCKTLEQEVDLSFYPQTVASFLQATSVKMEEGKLTIQLKLNL